MKRTIAIVLALLMISVLGIAFVSADETINLLPAADATWEKTDNNNNTVNIVDGNKFVGEMKTSADTWPAAKYTYASPISASVEDYTLSFDFTISGEGAPEGARPRGAIVFYFNGYTEGGYHLGNDVVHAKLNMADTSDDFEVGTYKADIKLSELKDATDPDWGYTWGGNDKGVPSGIVDGNLIIDSLEIYACGGGTVTINKLALVPNNASSGGDPEPQPEPKNEVVKDLGSVKGIVGVTVKSSAEAESVKISGSVDGKQFFDLNTGAAVAKNESGEYVLDFHTRGVINVQHVKVEGINDENAEITVTEGENGIDPQGPYTCTGLNEQGYGVIVLKKADLPNGFDVNVKDESITSNEKPINFPGGHIIIAQATETEGTYEILWTDRNAWNAEEKQSMHLNTPEGVEGITVTDGKVILADNQIAIDISSAGDYTVAGDGEYSNCKWIAGGLVAGDLLTIGNDKITFAKKTEAGASGTTDESGTSETEGPSYEETIKENMGPANENGKFEVELTGPQNYKAGEEIEITATVKNIAADAKLAQITFNLGFDTAKFELVNGNNDDGSLNLEATVPANWENLSKKGEEEGVVEVNFTNATNATDLATKDGDIVIKFKLKAKADATGEAGVWLDNETIESNDPDFNQYLGNGSYLIITAEQGTTESSETAPASSAVQTGDGSVNVIVLAIIALVAVVGCAVVIKTRR